MKCDGCAVYPFHFLGSRCDISIALEARNHLNWVKKVYGKIDGYVKIECFNEEDAENFRSFFTPEELKHIKITWLRFY